jgi:hypothetical protein
LLPAQQVDMAAQKLAHCIIGMAPVDRLGIGVVDER